MTRPLIVVIAAVPGDSIVLLESQLAGRSLSDALDDAVGAEVDSVLVSWLPATGRGAAQQLGRSSNVFIGKNPPAPLDRLLNRIGVSRLIRSFAMFPIGRLANSFAPTDQSRVFWRAVRREASVLELLSRADILIALDLAAVRSAWTIRQRRPRMRAYFGLQPAIREIARSQKRA